MTQLTDDVFVFVVCGAREHIDTIHYSLKALRRFTDKRIMVVTDSQRNVTPVMHSDLIDIETPLHFNHHQASIYLKTGLHKFLPTGKRYCYLDTDVVALSESVNDIFNFMEGAITFAADHCRLPEFSPYAVNCNCLAENEREWEEITELLDRHGRPPLVTGTVELKKQKELSKKFEFIKHNRFDMLQTAVRYLLPGEVMQLDGDTFYNKKGKYWFDTEGRIIQYDQSDSTIQKIEQASNWRWNNMKRRWISPGGKDITQLSCNHLPQSIFKKFGVNVTDHKWQHWNGGVFVFNDNSHAFMEAWHEKTLSIFTDREWKTRDQGTLIATAWQFGMQNAPMLPKKFNFIADYSNPKLMISTDGQYITDDAFLTKCAPAFIHVFHHFGATGWEVWDWVAALLSQGAEHEINTL